MSQSNFSPRNFQNPTEFQSLQSYSNFPQSHSPQFQQFCPNISQINSNRFNRNTYSRDSQREMEPDQISFLQQNCSQSQTNYSQPQSELNRQNSLRNQLNLPHGQNFNPHFIQTEPRHTFLRRLRCIPKFNGDSFTQLKEFIEITDSLYVSCINESEINELYQQILLQLRGEARSLVMNFDNTDWQSIKALLQKNFAYLASRDILTSQLENVWQNGNESLNVYAERVRNLLRDKNATYSYMTKDQKLEHNRLACKYHFSQTVYQNWRKK